MIQKPEQATIKVLDATQTFRETMEELCGKGPENVTAKVEAVRKGFDQEYVDPFGSVAPIGGPVNLALSELTTSQNREERAAGMTLMGKFLQMTSAREEEKQEYLFAGRPVPKYPPFQPIRLPAADLVPK